jgi:hypothetical protein
MQVYGLDGKLVGSEQVQPGTFRFFTDTGGILIFRVGEGAAMLTQKVFIR